MESLILTTVTGDQFNEMKTDVTELKKGLQTLLTLIQPPQQTEYLNRKEAAKLLKVSLVTLNEWTKEGIVQGYRIASRVRYKRTELEIAHSQINTSKNKRRAA